MIEALLSKNQSSAHRVDDRRLISGIFHVLKAGSQWQDCPSIFGPPTTNYNRFRRWSMKGVWRRLFQALAQFSADDVQMIDSTTATAHRSAGRGKGGPGPSPSYGPLARRPHDKHPFCCRWLPAFLDYAELIGDQSAKICVAFVLGMQSLQVGDVAGAITEFEMAKALYVSGGQETEVDPELELYLLEARVRTEGWSASCRQLLTEISEYVDAHAYSYYRPVVCALKHLSYDEAPKGRMSRLTRAHVARATGQSQY